MHNSSIWRLADAVITVFASTLWGSLSEENICSLNLIVRQAVEVESHTVTSQTNGMIQHCSVKAQKSTYYSENVRYNEPKRSMALRLCTEQLSFAKLNCIRVKNIFGLQKPVVFPHVTRAQEYGLGITANTWKVFSEGWFKLYFHQHDNSTRVGFLWRKAILRWRADTFPSPRMGKCFPWYLRDEAW